MMMRHYPHLGSASYWLNQNSHAARPIRSTTQIWVVTRRQNGISALVSQMSFGRKPVVASPNVGCFLRLNMKVLSIKKLSFTKMYAFSQAFQAHVTSVLCKFTFSQESRCRVTSNRWDFVWEMNILFLLFFCKINKGDFPLMYSCDFFGEVIDLDWFI